MREKGNILLNLLFLSLAGCNSIVQCIFRCIIGRPSDAMRPLFNPKVKFPGRYLSLTLVTVTSRRIGLLFFAIFSFKRRNDSERVC